MRSPFPRGSAVVLATALAIGLAAGCNSSNPVEPPAPTPSTSTTTFKVTLASQPNELEAGATTPATLTVNATRADNGQAPADGTQATINTSLGSFGTDTQGKPITLTTATLKGGKAQLQLFPGSDTGTASLLAKVGDSFGQLSVQIVESVPVSFFLLAVQPNVGNPEGGDQVTIQGEGFKAPLRVSFASALATVVAVTSSRTIVVETPPSVTAVQPGGSLLVDVAVTNSLDQADPPTATLTGAFTYAFETAPPFFISSISPTTGGAAGGTAVTIRGGGFAAPLTVSFGGKQATVTSVSSSSISVTTPAPASPVADGASLTVDVTIANALDQETPPAPQTLSGAFTYLGGTGSTPVTVTAISPASGPATGGTVVTVTGGGFVSPVAVELGGVRQLSETVVDAGTVKLTTAGVAVGSCPAGGVIPEMGVTVTNLSSGASGAGASLTFNYTVPLPLIRRVSPSIGSQLGNTLVTVEGQSFSDPVRVVFVASDQQFTGVVQGSVSPGSVRVATPRVPDSLFPQVDCVTADNLPGKRFQQVTVGVQLTNLATGCSDTVSNVFTYVPSDPNCEQSDPSP